MFEAAIALLASACVITGTSVYLELKYKEPVYFVAMKIGAALLAIGTIVFGCAVGL